MVYRVQLNLAKDRADWEYAESEMSGKVSSRVYFRV